MSGLPSAASGGEVSSRCALCERTHQRPGAAVDEFDSVGRELRAQARQHAMRFGSVEIADRAGKANFDAAERRVSPARRTANSGCRDRCPRPAQATARQASRFCFAMPMLAQATASGAVGFEDGGSAVDSRRASAGALAAASAAGCGVEQVRQDERKLHGMAERNRIRDFKLRDCSSMLPRKARRSRASMALDRVSMR